MKKQVHNTWPEARTQELMVLWITSMPAIEIGAILGVSKRSVIGKANRLGLARRANDHGNTEMRAAERKRRADAAKKSQRERESARLINIREKARITELAESAKQAAVDALKINDGVSLFDIARDRCRWPLNAACPIDQFRFCGTPTDGRSYCEHHYGLAYSNHPRRIRWGAEAVE